MLKTSLSLGLLLTLASTCGCGNTSNDSGGPAGSTASGGSAGAVANAGSGGGVDNSAGTSASAGTGDAAGAGGDGSGRPPVDGSCGLRSLKHPDGLCYCQPSTLTACTGGCFDPEIDPDHCGDCDTQCEATQACSAGKCGATPSTVVAAADGCGALHLALTAGTLLWTDTMHGTVQSLDVAGGGDPVSIAEGQMAPTIIQVSTGFVYWLNSGDQSIARATTAGANVETVVTIGTDVGGFTISEDGATLYFSTGTQVNSTTTMPGGAITEVGHEDTGIPHALAVEGDLIAYPADQTGDIDIMTMMEGTPAVCASADSTTATNSNCVRIARSQGSLYLDTVYLIDQNAYWANQAVVQTSPATASDPINLTVARGASAASRLTAFTINEGSVYLTDDTGLVAKAPLMTDAETTSLARAQDGVTSMAADATTLYWAAADCAIHTVPVE